MEKKHLQHFTCGMNLTKVIVQTS